MLAILVIGPLLALFAGLVVRELKLHAAWSAVVSLLIPLLFIATSRLSLISNLDAWIIYGLAYAAVALLSYRLSGRRTSNV